MAEVPPTYCKVDLAEERVKVAGILLVSILLRMGQAVRETETMQNNLRKVIKPRSRC